MTPRNQYYLQSSDRKPASVRVQKLMLSDLEKVSKFRKLTITRLVRIYIEEGLTLVNENEDIDLFSESKYSGDNDYPHKQNFNLTSNAKVDSEDHTKEIGCDKSELWRAFITIGLLRDVKQLNFVLQAK